MNQRPENRSGADSAYGTVGFASVEVGYIDSDKRIRVRVVSEWRRPLESIGSSPSFRNIIAATLHSIPAIEGVRMLCGECRTSVPFCVFCVQGRWFDCLQKEVVFS